MAVQVRVTLAGGAGERPTANAVITMASNARTATVTLMGLLIVMGLSCVYCLYVRYSHQQYSTWLVEKSRGDLLYATGLSLLNLPGSSLDQ